LGGNTSLDHQYSLDGLQEPCFEETLKFFLVHFMKILNARKMRGKKKKKTTKKNHWPKEKGLLYLF